LSWGNVVWHGAAQGVASRPLPPDTEEDGGSTPPAPTESLLSSAFVGLLVRLVDGIGRRGHPPIGRRLTLALVLRAPVPADRAAEAIATIDKCSTALRSVRASETVTNFCHAHQGTDTGSQGRR
jgi:hypothetical protein